MSWFDSLKATLFGEPDPIPSYPNRAARRSASGGPRSLRAMKCVTLVRGLGPAVSDTDIKATGSLTLSKTSSAIKLSLDKKSSAKGLRGRVILALDHSRSMYGDYERRDKPIQTLVERALAFGFQVSSSGKITVLPFDSVVHKPIEVDRTNYKGIVDRKIWQPSNMGGTNMVAVLEQVRQMSEESDEPIILLFVTDGRPDTGQGEFQDREDTIRAICRLAGYPVFVKFLSLRDNSFLVKLDRLEDTHPGLRLMDAVNSAFFDDRKGEENHYTNIYKITDEEFAEAATEEIDDWVDRALHHGTLVEAAA